MSERVTSEVERVMKTRSTTSPALSSDVTQTIQQDTRKLEAMCKPSIANLSKEIQEVKTKMTTRVGDEAHSDVL